MKNKVTVTILLVVFGWLGSLQARTFTSKDGRTIEANIETVRPPNVVLKRQDGKTFTMAVSKLSEKDIAYVKSWYEANPTISLDYRFEKQKLGSSGSKSRRKETWAYKVTVSNRSTQALEGLSFHYEIFKEINDRYAKKRRYLSGKKGGKKEGMTLNAAGKLSFVTDSITTESVNKKTESSTTITYEKWDEDLSGIILVVKHNGVVVDTKEFGTVPK